MAVTRDEIEFIARFRVEALRAAEQAVDMLHSMGGGAEEAGRDFENMSEQVEGAADTVIASFAALGASALAAYATISGGLQAYGEYNQSLIGIAKTANLTDESVGKLGASLQDLAIQKGIDVSEYTAVAGIAGQLGVKGAADIEAFTSVIVDLGNASNLAGEQGAQTLARMLAVSGEHVSEANRLASVIVRLGNNVAASEREIAETAQEIALSTAPFEVGTTRVTALAAALAEMGLNPALTGTTIGRLFVEITNAATKGGDSLRQFSEATGLTADEFLRLQETDPTQILMALLKTMNGMDTKQVVRTLTEMNVMNSETAKSLLPLISNYERLEEVMGLALAEAANPRAMAEEAARAEEAFSRMFARVREAFTANMVELGATFAPIANIIMQGMLDVMAVFRDLPEPIRQTVLVLTGIAPVILAAVAAARTYTAVTAALGIQLGIVNAAHVAMAAVLPTIRAAYLALAISVRTLGIAQTVAAVAAGAFNAALSLMLGPVGLAVAAVGGLVATFAFLGRDTGRDIGQITDAFNEASSTIGGLNADLKRDYEDLTKAREALTAAAKTGDEEGVLAARREMQGIQGQIDKTRELIELEKIRREAALAEAKESALSAQQDYLKELRNLVANTFEGINWMGDNPELMGQMPDMAFEEQRDILIGVLNDVQAEARNALDWSKFDMAEETMDNATAGLAALQEAVEKLDEAGNMPQARAGIESVDEAAGDALANMRTLEQLVGQYAGRATKLRDLEAERSAVLEAQADALASGNTDAAAGYEDVARAIVSQITELTAAEDRVRALQTAQQELKDTLRNSDFVGQTMVERLLSSWNEQLVEALGNVENLNDADLSQLERGFQGISDIVTSLTGVFGGALDALKGGQRGMTRTQIEGYQQYGRSRVEGADQRTDNVLDAVYRTIIAFEGRLDSAAWDVNHDRAGFGSDTVTAPDGSYRPTRPGEKVDEAGAMRDLQRRVDLYMAEQQRVMGPLFAKMTDAQVAAIASIQHNYGRIPERLSEALKTGNNQYVAEIISGMAQQYTKTEREDGSAARGEQPINYNRRMEEAAAFGTTTAFDASFQLELESVGDAYDEAKKAADEAAQKVKEHQEAVQKFNEEKVKEAQILAFTNSVQNLSVTEREKAIELYKYELELKEKGLQLDQQIAGGQGTYREQWEAVRAQATETIELIPALRDAIDVQIQGIGDAAAVASTVTGEIASAFDGTIDHILDKGFRDMQGLAAIFGDSFKNMGAALIKFALQALILEPILKRLKSSLENMGTGGGGGGFLNFLGSAIGSVFGGTSTGKSAKGNVFRQSQTVPMMMMGEAGEEALIPLSRMPDGSLGVKMIGAPGAQSDPAMMERVMQVMGEIAGVVREVTGMVRSGYESAERVVAGTESVARAANADGGSTYAPEPVTAPGGQPIGADRAAAFSFNNQFVFEGGGRGGGNDATGGMSDQQAAQFGESLNAHIRRQIIEFMTDQSRSGGLLNRAV